MLLSAIVGAFGVLLVTIDGPHEKVIFFLFIFVAFSTVSSGFEGEWCHLTLLQMQNFIPRKDYLLLLTSSLRL